MAPFTRRSLARNAYLAALRAARTNSTPFTWSRLLRAARNLREAEADAERVAARNRRRWRGE